MGDGHGPGGIVQRAHPHKGQAIARTYGREHLRRVFLGHGGVGYVLEPLPASKEAPADMREGVPA